MPFLSPFRKARRRRILERSPIADGLWDWAMREHPIFARLVGAERNHLRELATIFLGEKVFDPIGGVEIDDAMKVSIAAQACLPLLGLDIDWYSDWSTIMVTPRGHGVLDRDVDSAGVVREYEDEFAGEAFALGPVALSKSDVEVSGWGDGYNVVIHEMAHKLDGRDGNCDGCPPLHPDMDPGAWRDAFSSAYADLRAKLGKGAARKARRRGPRIDPYAAESPDEFFAVVCEYFFEEPFLLKSEYPGVYRQLALFFRQDPAAG